MLRIVSVAKVAAYILMTAALVAFVACELDPGEKGEQGTKGTQGTAGERGLRGAKGEPGTAPAAPDASTPYVGELYARGLEADAYLVLVNDGVGVVGDPSDLDLADRFRGGTPPLTYSIPSDGDNAPTADGPFAVKLDEATGMLTVTVNADYAFVPVTLADTGMETTFTVKATDADGATDDKEVSIKRNAPPVRTNTPHPTAAVTVTTQAVTPAEGEDTPAGCPKRNFCTRTVLVAATATDNPLYMDELPESVLLEVDDGGGANVRVVLAGHELTFTGLKSTWNSTTDADAPKTIKVSATDARGLEAVTASGATDEFVTFTVTVDAPPTIKAPFPSGVSLTKGVETPAVGAALSEFFNDPDNGGDALTYTAESDTPTIVEVAEEQNTGNLRVTPLDAGSATITVTATDKNEQSVSQTVTIRVTES